MSNFFPPQMQGVAGSLIATTVNYSISLGLGLASTVEVHVNNNGRDPLAGIRGGWFMGVGLGGLGVVICVAFVIKSILHPTPPLPKGPPGPPPRAGGPGMQMTPHEPAEGKKSRSRSIAEVIRLVLDECQTRKVVVPGNFPLSLAMELRELGVKVKPRPGNFFPEREEKSAEEVKKISAALMMAEVGLSEGIQALKSAKIGKDRKLIYHNAPLTSEKLRSIIDTAIIQASGVASHTIVAGGRQACDPHETGHGSLRANEPIILDVFPRSQKTGYFGDITRTVVRGRASEGVRRLYDTVLRGQSLGFKAIRAGVPTKDVHQAIVTFFDQQGYKTGRRHGRMEGFFHGTGHGLGLEIHESPRVNSTSTTVLKAGQVVTVLLDHRAPRSMGTSRPTA